MALHQLVQPFLCLLFAFSQIVTRNIFVLGTFSALACVTDVIQLSCSDGRTINATASTSFHTASLATTTVVRLTPCMTELSWCMTTVHMTGWPSSYCVTVRKAASSRIPERDSVHHATRVSLLTMCMPSTIAYHVSPTNTSTRSFNLLCDFSSQCDVMLFHITYVK